MQVNQTTLTAYNKFNGKNQGTLIGNWYEERVIKDVTGVGRTVPGSHIKKDRKELFTKPPEDIEYLKHPRQQDDTNERTLGKKTVQWPTSEGHEYGKGKNRADFLRQQGQKSLKREDFFLQQIDQELKEQERQQDKAANSRQFDTTAQAEFYKKDPLAEGNVVGKRVMKTQNGEPVPESQKDDDFLVDQGCTQRQQFLNDDQLKKYLPRGETYLTQQPITFWQEKQNDGCFYMSKQNQENSKQTFNLNNQYLKTYTHYTHIKN